MRIAVLILAALMLGAVSGGFLATQPVGHPCMRLDAQLCVQNITGGHALVSIENVRNPGDEIEEAAVSFGAFSDSGMKKQMASISAVWGNNASVANGRGVLRFNVAGVDESSRVDMILHGRAHGLDLFCSLPSPLCERASPGGPFVRITRTVGFPSIVGKNDLVLDGTRYGDGQVFLNAYSTGDVRIALGGGKVQIGTPVSAACPNGWKECLPMLDRNGTIFYVQVAR